MEEIELKPLYAKDGESYLKALFMSTGVKSSPDSVVLQLLLSLGGGNPTFLKQLLDHSLYHDLLNGDTLPILQSGEYEFLPPAMEAAAFTLLSRFETLQRDLIRVASIYHGCFSTEDIFAFVKDDVCRADLNSQLSKLVQEGVLEIDGNTFSAKYRFAQESFRLVAYNTIPQGDRALLDGNR